SWQQGRRALAEEYLARHPGLSRHRDGFLRLICEELYLRREAGLEPSATELTERFPEWAKELRALLDCHRLIAQPGEGTEGAPPRRARPARRARPGRRRGAAAAAGVRPGARVPGAGLLRPGGLLARRLPRRRAAIRPRARPGPPRPQAVERAARRRRPADAPR